jgi:hypothetical protein
MQFQAQHLLVAWTKWRLIDMELNATEWRGGYDASGQAIARPLRATTWLQR